MIASEASAPRGRVLCLGEAFVELVCERHVDDVAHAEAFVPRVGGTVATVAMAAARTGATVAMTGGAGDDSWGHWLRDRLAREGVDASLFELLPGIQTPLALVAIDGHGEPTYTRYGERLGAVVAALQGRLEAAVAQSGALLMSSDTLAQREERTVTMRAREGALVAGLPVVFEARLHLDRWRSQADAAASANACVPRALLVRTTERDAEVMTGEQDPERAALALVKAGARLVVVTLGSEGAMLRGELRADVHELPGELVSPIGSGEVLTGVLLARLALSDFYPSAVAASLREAVAASVRACERWGAA